MAIFHMQIKTISATTRSAISSAAYRAGEKLHSERFDKTSDFRNKKEVAYSEIIGPENMPAEFKNREKLWNSVEKIEKAKNGRFARDIVVALPNELSQSDQIKLVHEFVKEQFVNQGMIADWSLHAKQGNNHAHIMLTTRSLKKDGSWAPKSKNTYVLDDNGDRIPIIDKKTGKQKLGARNAKLWKKKKTDYNDWNKKENAEIWRKAWADKSNQYLAPNQKIDHRSYERQGRLKIPTIHEGYIARKIEERGGKSERIEINQTIREINRVTWLELNNLKKLKRKIQELSKKIMDKVNEIKSYTRNTEIEEFLNGSREKLKRNQTIDKRIRNEFGIEQSDIREVSKRAKIKSITQAKTRTQALRASDRTKASSKTDSRSQKGQFYNNNQIRSLSKARTR